MAMVGHKDQNQRSEEYFLLGYFSNTDESIQDMDEPALAYKVQAAALASRAFIKAIGNHEDRRTIKHTIWKSVGEQAGFKV